MKRYTSIHSASLCLSCHLAIIMKAVVYDSPHVVKVVDKEIPKAGPGEAIVKVSLPCSMFPLR